MDIWNHDAICTPCLILQPKDNREVAACLRGYVAGVDKCLAANKKSSKKDGGAPLALAIPRLTVAGGRNSIHCMMEGSIVVDLSKMRAVKVDMTNQTCRVQGGARVIDVDAKLQDYGLISVLGTSQHIGVIGCILGGGMGYASRKYGLACDNVLSADVIQADGRIYQCNFTKHRDLLWAICGGGGGLGIVVSVTLRCYPLRHAALLTYDLPTSGLNQRRNIIRHWSNWALNNVDNDKFSMEDDEYIIPSDKGAENEVFTQLILPTQSSGNIHFVASSIDAETINQTDGYVEEFENAKRKSKKRSPFSFLKNDEKQKDKQKKKLVLGWSDVPSLNLLVNDSFHSTRSNVEFRMVRYSDQLQSYSNEYYTPGNIFSSTKYCTELSNRIVEVLAHATCSDISPKNESKIILIAMDGQIRGKDESERQHLNDHSSFCWRDSKYMIYIEGKWDAASQHKAQKEKNKVVKWVRWVVNQLAKCEGVKSSCYPESTRDQVSKSGRTLEGYYNFNKETGKTLAYIKQRKDPKNVFSLASRISWPRSSDRHGRRKDDSTDGQSIITELSKADHVKNGEVDPTQCFTPKKAANTDESDEDSAVDIYTKGSSHSLGVDITESGEKDEEENNTSTEESAKTSISSGNPSSGDDDDDTSDDYSASVSSDVRRLLSITDSDDIDGVKDWTLAPVNALTQCDFEGGSSSDDGEEYSVASAGFSHVSV